MRTPITWTASVLVIPVGLSIALLSAGSSSGQAQVCGNGVVEPPETCDPPSTPCVAGSPAGAFLCAFNCQCTCGNGVKDANEDCDPSSPSGAFCQNGPCNPSTCMCPASTTTTTTSPTTTTTVPDHQQCYEVKPASFPPVSVQAQDEFGTLTLSLRFPHRLCAPADKNGEGIHDSTGHLTGYLAKGSFSKVLDLTVVDQFGTHELDVVRPVLFLVPTSKDGVQQQQSLDHFTCYKVTRAQGAAKFTPGSVSVSDQFETVTETLLKPVTLCTPANKNGEDPSAPSHAGHLLCYKTRPFPFAEGTHAISNQFGADQVTLIHRRELCVPLVSLKASDEPWFQDEVDGGDKPLVAGCHYEYSDPACSMNKSFLEGDKCLTKKILREWTGWDPAGPFGGPQACHQHFQDSDPLLGLDTRNYDCDAYCKKTNNNQNATGKCVVVQNVCDNNTKPSAQCECS